MLIGEKVNSQFAVTYCDGVALRYMTLIDQHTSVSMEPSSNHSGSTWCREHRAFFVGLLYSDSWQETNTSSLPLEARKSLKQIRDDTEILLYGFCSAH